MLSKAAKGSGMDRKVSTRTLHGMLGRVQESGVMGPTCACSLCMQLWLFHDVFVRI